MKYFVMKKKLAQEEQFEVLVRLFIEKKLKLFINYKNGKLDTIGIQFKQLDPELKEQLKPFLKRKGKVRERRQYRRRF